MIFWKKHKPKNAIEVPDPEPIAMPARMQRPPTLQEQLARYTRQTLNNMAKNDGKESFEDADDFEIGEEWEPASRHEIEFGPEGEQRFSEFAGRILTKREAAASALKAKNEASKAGATPPKKDSKTPPNEEA